jgi:hypothetical protein
MTEESPTTLLRTAANGEPLIWGGPLEPWFLRRMLATRGQQLYVDVTQNAKGLTVLSACLSRYLGSSPESRF